MVRCHLLLGLLVTSALVSWVEGAGPLPARNTRSKSKWAYRMFTSASPNSNVELLQHDFGVVPRGSKQEHFFPIRNLYAEDVHIEAIESTCGCTTAQVTKHTLRSREVGYIVARLNTKSFVGRRTAVLTVRFDKPYPAEVQLKIAANIHTDLEITPDSLTVGAIPQGQPLKRVVNIRYTGKANWRITGIQVTHPSVEAEAVELKRQPGDAIEYAMTVEVLGNAPAGFLRETITVFTNDRSAKRIPIELRAQIEPSIVARPANLFLGVCEPGETKTKQVVVKGDRPFRITKVACSERGFTIQPVQGVRKSLHLVPVTFTAGSSPGQIDAKITIEVDQGQAITLELHAHAQVSPAQPRRSRRF